LKREESGETPRARSWIEIDQGALRKNLRTLQERSGSKRVLAVVKANAYGLGVHLVAPALAGPDTLFAVACLSEARELRELRPQAEIVLLSPVLDFEREEAVAHDFVLTVSSVEEARAISELGGAEVHVKIDTGMGRIGVLPGEAKELLATIWELGNLSLHSISTHLPSADEDEDFTRDQLQRFAGLLEELQIGDVPVHALNSAGILAHPEFDGDIARPGLALYGVSPDEAFQEYLERVVTWKAAVLLVRNLPPGHGVSYGRSVITGRPTRTAILGVGYADGYPRQASLAGAYVLINGARCPLLGRVTMDQLVIDVTDAPEVQAGEIAILIGRDGDEEITAWQLARWANTIPWHIFTGLGRRVQRTRLR